MDNRKITIRIGKQRLSFSAFDETNSANPVLYETYIAKVGVSMSANLREAFKTVQLLTSNIQQAQILVDAPFMLVPIEQFEENEIEELFNHVFPSELEKRAILFNVLPNLNVVCVFAINKDIYNVITDRFEKVQFIQASTPVWHHLHKRSFTGHHNKLYGYFHEKQLDIFCFQQNRFKFCNTFEATQCQDSLYFLLNVWKQLRMEAEQDEIHIVGKIPEQDNLLQELKRYLCKVFIINPSADFQQSPVSKVADIPYDLMTFLVRGR